MTASITVNDYVGVFSCSNVSLMCLCSGVDVCIRDFTGRCLRIRESSRVKVGRIAKGISEQISERTFSLQSEDGRLVHHDELVQTSGLFLRCVRAPDCCRRFSKHAPDCSLPWSWRIRNGALDLRE